MRADTNHIRACDRAWMKHYHQCEICLNFLEPTSLCETGKVLFDEYRSAITADRDCESVEASVPRGTE